MKSLIASLFFLTPTLGCGEDALPDGQYANYAYSNVLAEGELCEQWQETGVNCAQTLSLRADGSATIIVTDIINPGTWLDSPTQVETHWSAQGDVVEEIIFDKADNGSDLVDINGDTWVRGSVLE